MSYIPWLNSFNVCWWFLPYYLHSIHLLYGTTLYLKNKKTFVFKVVSILHCTGFEQSLCMCHPKITNVYVYFIILWLLFNLDKICLVICPIKRTSIITHHSAEVGRRSASARDWMDVKKRQFFSKSNIAGPNHRVPRPRHAF